MKYDRKHDKQSLRQRLTTALTRTSQQLLEHFKSTPVETRTTDDNELQPNSVRHSFSSELFAELLIELPEHQKNISQAYEAGNLYDLRNNVHQLLFFLVDCFPDARFIFQVRDPRDFLLSCVARRKRWMGNKFGSIRNAMNVWREDQLGGLTAYGLLGPDRLRGVVGSQANGKFSRFSAFPFDCLSAG